MITKISPLGKGFTPRTLGYIINSPHKLSFQITMWADDQKLRYGLVWPTFPD